jgi:endoglucanase
MELLRGLNIGGWLSQIDAIKEKDPSSFSGVDRHMETFINKSDFSLMKTWGFNHVRLPIDAYLFFTDKADPIETRLATMDRAVRWASETGLDLMLDLHECPGHDFADTDDVPIQKFFIDPECFKKTEKIWACLAERYGDRPHVIFEALNEPVAPTAEIWNKFKDRLCRNIRDHAPKSPIVIGSNMWNAPATYDEMTLVELDSIIYCFHLYEPLLFTHQFAPWIKEPEIRQKRSYPADYGKGFTRKYGFVHSEGFWNKERLAREVGRAHDFGKKYSVPVICNEFGVYAPVGLEHQLLWLSDLLSVLKDRGIGFTYWNYKNLDFGIISRGEKLHEGLQQYDNPERINFPVLAALRRY